MTEAQRQQSLLAALAGVGGPVHALRESGARAARGLEAYRANAESVAERTLAASFATLQALVGEEDFGQLAREFWRAEPPARGDLGEWGEALPAWLEAHAQLAAWPWLADCARLDLAVHRNERAADASFDAASLSLLESTDPAALRIELMPGTALLRSRWPIATLHAAHQVPADEAEGAFAAVRAAIAAQRGEQAMVVRKGWRAVVVPRDAITASWTQDLLDDVDLHTALARAGEGFDFAVWLGDALRESWLRGVVASRD